MVSAHPTNPAPAVPRRSPFARRVAAPGACLVVLLTCGTATLLQSPVRASPRRGAENSAAALDDPSPPPVPDGEPAEPGGVEPADQDEVRAARSWLNLAPTELELELSAEWDRRRVGVSGSRGRDQSHRNEDRRFTESLSFRFDGDVLDPKLIAFDGGIRLGLSQERFREEIDWFRRTESDNGLLLEYDLSLRILPDKPISATAYGRQLRDRVPRQFLPSLVEEVREAGAAITLREGGWTSEVGFDYSDTDRSGNRFDRDDETRRRNRFYLDNRWEIDDDHDLRVAYDHEREESRYQGSRYRYDTRRDQLRIEHELAFGPAKRHRLDTTLRWNNEQGDLARDELEFTPRLRLRHSDAFETIYRYSLNRVEQDAIESNRHRLDWETITRPTDHLRFGTDLFWLRDAIEHDLETHQYGGLVDLTFDHPTSAGELRLYASLGGDQARTMGSGRDGVVRGETHVLDSSRAIYLQEPDVARHTVRAYNINRTRVYLEGRDYRLVTVGRRTLVYRLLSGAIAEDDPVSFDYSYRVPTGSRRTTYRTDFRLEHRFDGGWTPYYEFESRRQDADGSRGAVVFEDDTERHRVGLRYRQDQWSASAEYEVFRDAVDPFEAWHGTVQATLLDTAQQTIDAGAKLSRYHFSEGGEGRFAYYRDETSRRVWVFDMDLAHRVRLDRYWSARLATRYRWEDNSAIGETNGVDIEGGLHYERGLLGVDLTAEYDLLSLDDSREEGYGVYLTIRRDLSHLFDRERAAMR